MNLSLKVEGTKPVQDALSTLSRKDAKAAVRLWTNWIGLEAQGEMRKQLPTRFSFRGTQEGFEKAIVFQASQNRGPREMQAVLKVGGPGFGGSRTQKLGILLARHEEGTTRTQSDEKYIDGRGRVFTAGFYLPARGLRTASTNPPKGMYPKAIGASLRATPSGVTRASGTKKGSKKGGTGVSYFANKQGIFRRRHTGFGGRVQVEAVWLFRSAIRTPARLGLWDSAERVFQARAQMLGMQAVDEAVFRGTLR